MLSPAETVRRAAEARKAEPTPVFYSSPPPNGTASQDLDDDTAGGPTTPARGRPKLSPAETVRRAAEARKEAALEARKSTARAAEEEDRRAPALVLWEAGAGGKGLPAGAPAVTVLSRLARQVRYLERGP